MHPKERVDEARRLYATGLTAADIARRMGLPWKTVAHWCRGDRRPAGVDRTVCPRCTGADLDEGRYAYLLGQYLGDGHITTSKRKRNVHRPGKKHTRPIVVGESQQKILDTHPGLFLRGLIHSDGCRVINRFKTLLPSGRLAEYAYPRYFFSNLSADIRGLFCVYCERLGVRWTQSNPRNISVSHRRSVAILDEFVGPKA